MDSVNFLISPVRDLRDEQSWSQNSKKCIEKSIDKTCFLVVYEINMQTHCKLSIKKQITMLHR